MWLALALVGAAGYYLYREGVFGSHALPDGVTLIGDVQHFTPDSKVAILSMLGMVDLVQVTEVQGAKTFRMVPTTPNGTTAGAAVTQAIANGMLVGASVSLLNTNPEEHFITIAFPNGPGIRDAIAEPGSPMALLHDPALPGV